MNKLLRVLLVLFGVAAVDLFTGCSTGINAAVTTDRGVYTTVAISGEDLDLPNAGYARYHAFSPNQAPAAVVVGYGYYDGSFNHPQHFTLQVIEAVGGGVVYTVEGDDFYGKAAVFQLPIRKSGSYKLKLLIDGSVYDTWDFTVTGALSEGATSQVKSPAYAKGDISASIDSGSLNDAFTGYDDDFGRDLANAAAKEYGSPNTDTSLFAQILPGQVVIEFDLTPDGQVSAAKIGGNTLGEPLGQFFLHALQNGAPYKVWPAAAHAAFGADIRHIKVTYFLD